MNEAHFHLIVNHLPIIFPIVGLIVILSGFIFKLEVLKRMAFVIFVIGSLSTIAAMSSGEGAEEIVENISGVSHDYIETHEEAAEAFAITSYILGALSLIALWANLRKKKFSVVLTVLVFLMAGVVIFLGSRTGTTGGEIRHEEIRANFIP
jgi:uncharacterized membrane protein